MLKTAVRIIGKFTHSLSFKLSFYAGLTMLTALLAFSYHSISTQEKNLVDKIIQGALKDSEVIKAAIWNGMMTNDRQVIREIVRAIGGQGFERINIYDAKGVLHYSSHDLAESRSAARTKALLEGIAGDTRIRHRFADDGRSIYVVNPLVNTESCSSAACHAHPQSEKVLGALEVKLPLDRVKEEISRSTKQTVVFGILLFILISTVNGLAAIFLVNRNLAKLTGDAARMARGEFRLDAPMTGSDEMAEFSRSFEDMGRRIKERTEDLDHRRRYNKSLFEEAPCYMTVVSKDYRIVRANRTFREQFGDQLGKNCFAGYKGLDAKCEKCPVEKTFADGFSHQSEEVWKLEDEDAYVMVKTSPIYDDVGNISEVLEMSVDVTRLKKLQMELRRKQEEYRYLFENAPCYLTVVDRDFNIAQTNALFDRDFGPKNVGNKCFAVYKKRDSKCENCPVEKTFMDGQSHTSEEVWRRNGDPTYVVVSTAPVTDDKGNILAVMEMSTNITEIKRLQGELATLGETVAGMSHNIKNILSGLQGGVYVMDSGLTRGKQDRVEAGWQMVKNNVQKVSDLVQGILYASKERTPEYKECDPGTLLAEVCDLYEERAAKEAVSFKRDFDAEMGLFLLDPTGIHSALSNLVSNALDACRSKAPAGPCRVKVAGRIEGSRLLVQVSDSGEGIPEEVKDSLFNKFYSTKGAKGTGLGLVITRKVIEEHGGGLNVESQLGRGTTFFIEIPLKSVRNEEAVKAAV
ncbi:MAG: PAS domain-containing protein [Desulfomonile tiedjei]|nr:PAS domain-containing protein [Desulfomonile tiedjei]